MREKYQCVVASGIPSTGDLAGNPGMCPDRESNGQPFSSQAGAQSSELHQPGLFIIYMISFSPYINAYISLINF